MRQGGFSLGRPASGHGLGGRQQLCRHRSTVGRCRGFRPYRYARCTPQPYDIRSAYWEHGGERAWFCCGSRLVPVRSVSWRANGANQMCTALCLLRPSRSKRGARAARFRRRRLERISARRGCHFRGLPDLPTEEPAGRHASLRRSSWAADDAILECTRADFAFSTTPGKVMSPMRTEPDGQIETAEFSRQGDLIAIAQSVAKTPNHRLRIYRTKDLTLLQEIPLKHSVVTAVVQPGRQHGRARRPGSGRCNASTSTPANSASRLRSCSMASFGPSATCATSCWSPKGRKAMSCCGTPQPASASAPPSNITPT